MLTEALQFTADRILPVAVRETIVIHDRRLERLKANWKQAVDEVRSAAIGAGRSPTSVRIVGVTKYVDVETTTALVAAGCTELGESRPQRLFDKATSLAAFAELRWHLIGHLQGNKVRRSVHVAHTIHSIDTLKLLRHVDKVAGELGKMPEVLIEVNISGDEAKHGFSPEALLGHCQELGEVTHVKVVGLMGMAGLHCDLGQAQREFALLRSLRDRLSQASGLPLRELSMGMSGDFVPAITEGATIVRIGSRLFDGLGDPAC